MMWIDATVLAFKGSRFEGGTLDVDVLSEYGTYKHIVAALAEDLWRGRNPERARIPRGFHDSFRLCFREVKTGSAVTPLQRSRPDALIQLRDDFDDAIDLLTETVRAVGTRSLLPRKFPKHLLPDLARLGLSLQEDEWLEFAPERLGSAAVRYGREERQTVLSLVGDEYEDEIDVEGAVLATSLRRERFEIYPTEEARTGIEVPLRKEDEPVVLEALRRHDTCRVRVRGIGQFRSDGVLMRVSRVDEIVRLQTEESGADLAAFWDELSTLGETVGAETWRSVPADGARNVDRYLNRKD